MREIKFRAWDIEGENMYNWEEICLDVIFKVLNSDELEVMQYTGLKDKNGVEIYEGDIVHFNYENAEWYAELKYIEGEYVVYHSVFPSIPIHGITIGRHTVKEIWGAFNNACEYHYTDIYVAGNIYENANLLEG